MRDHDRLNLRTFFAVLTVSGPLLLPACQAGSSHPPLDPSRFAAVFAAVLEEDAASHTARRDSAAAAAGVRRVLDSAGVTAPQLQESARAYNADMEQWRLVLDEVTRQLEERARHRSGR